MWAASPFYRLVQAGPRAVGGTTRPRPLALCIWPGVAGKGNSVLGGALYLPTLGAKVRRDGFVLRELVQAGSSTSVIALNQAASNRRVRS